MASRSFCNCLGDSAKKIWQSSLSRSASPPSLSRASILSHDTFSHPPAVGSDDRTLSCVFTRPLSLTGIDFIRHLSPQQTHCSYSSARSRLSLPWDCNSLRWEPVGEDLLPRKDMPQSWIAGQLFGRLCGNWLH